MAGLSQGHGLAVFFPELRHQQRVGPIDPEAVHDTGKPAGKREVDEADNLKFLDAARREGDAETAG